MTYAQYLATEEVGALKHEYLHGEVFAMAGGSPDHAALAMSVGAALLDGLRGKPCRVFSSDLRVRVMESDLSTYPDVTVVCEHLQYAPDDTMAIVNPLLIVEVLSPATEAWDRGEKFSHYRRLSSLREYLLVAQDTPRLELFRRSDAGHWELHDARSGAALELTSVGITLHVDDIYRNPLGAQGDAS